MSLRLFLSCIMLSLLVSHCGPSDRNKPAPASTASAEVLPADSLARLEAILKAEPLNVEAWYDKGMLLAEIKDSSAAIEALEMSFRLQPLEMSGIALANLYAERGNNRALALCNAMLKKDTAHTMIDPVFIKGIYYTKTGQPSLAIAAFDECIRRDWKFTEAYMEKGILLFNGRQLPEALKVFQLAATVTNTYADAYFWIGRCYETMGQKKEAAYNYARALSLDKDFAEAAAALERINIR